MLPIPRPAASIPIIIPGFAELCSFRSSLMAPEYVELKLPAKKPYIAEKIKSSGTDEARPHSTNTENVAPIVDIKVTVVTWKRSMSTPTKMQPKTAEEFNRATVVVTIALSRPSERAYVGR